MSPFGVLALGFVIGAVAWYLLITTEGVYLGRRVVIWLYDVYARRYDRIKQFDPAWESERLGVPLLLAHHGPKGPRVLDVATGTARLPLALLAESAFRGQIVGLDLSRKMLGVAAEKLAALDPAFATPVMLVHQAAEHLPFPDATFDLVTCLEALEFTAQPAQTLAELVRVAKPGATILLSNRKGAGARLMPGRTWSGRAFKAALETDYGLEAVRVEIWQMDYEQVWARKPRRTAPLKHPVQSSAPHVPLESLLCCPQCAATGFERANDDSPVLRCLACGAVIPLGADGVVEYAARVAMPHPR